MIDNIVDKIISNIISFKRRRNLLMIKVYIKKFKFDITLLLTFFVNSSNLYPFIISLSFIFTSHFHVLIIDLTSFISSSKRPILIIKVIDKEFNIISSNLILSSYFLFEFNFIYSN